MRFFLPFCLHSSPVLLPERACSLCQLSASVPKVDHNRRALGERLRLVTRQHESPRRPQVLHLWQYRTQQVRGAPVCCAAAPRLPTLRHQAHPTRRACRLPAAVQYSLTNLPPLPPATRFPLAQGHVHLEPESGRSWFRLGWCCASQAPVARARRRRPEHIQGRRPCPSILAGECAAACCAH